MAKPTIEELLQRLDQSHVEVNKAMQGAMKVQREVLARFRELRRSMMGEVTPEK
jgi:hypothetical protein